MASIVWVILPLSGSFNASVKLARDLKDAGHQVSYLGLPDSEDEVCGNGFEFTPVFERWFPKGFYAEHEKLGLMGLAEALPAIRDMVGRFNAFIEALLADRDTSFAAAVDRLRPDLMLFVNSGETVTIPALLAHAAGIRSAYVYDMLCRGEDLAIPPVTTPLPPGNTLRARGRVFMAWKRVWFARRVVEKACARLGLQVDWPRMVGRLAIKCGYPPGQIDTLTDTAAFRMRLPELVLYPLEFEFPGAGLPGRHHIEASIDLSRRQCEFPWEWLAPGRPLGLCAVGTMVWLGRPALLRFFQTVIDAAAGMPDWQWVVATGNGLDAGDFDGVPPNVVVVNRAPQLALLERAGLMINHGGANTVKECAYFGVPMILFPHVNDTPGVTARAVYHGLGLRGDILRITAPALRDLIGQIDGTCYYRAQARLMSLKFREAEQAGEGLRLVEALLATPAPCLPPRA